MSSSNLEDTIEDVKKSLSAIGAGLVKALIDGKITLDQYDRLDVLHRKATRQFKQGRYQEANGTLADLYSLVSKTID